MRRLCGAQAAHGLSFPSIARSSPSPCRDLIAAISDSMHGVLLLLHRSSWLITAFLCVFIFYLLYHNISNTLTKKPCLRVAIAQHCRAVGIYAITERLAAAFPVWLPFFAHLAHLAHLENSIFFYIYTIFFTPYLYRYIQAIVFTFYFYFFHLLYLILYYKK